MVSAAPLSASRLNDRILPAHIHRMIGAAGMHKRQPQLEN